MKATVTIKRKHYFVMNPERKLRIAVLVKRFVNTGGAERYALEVTRRLARQHEVHVFAQEWAFEGKETIIFHNVPKVVSKPSWLNQLLFSYFSKKVVASTRTTFDIIHSHEKVTHFDIATIHSPCFRSLIGQEGSWLKRALLWVSRVISPRKMGWLWLERKQFARNSKKVFIVVSEKVKKNIQANYFLPERSLYIAYPGVDPSINRNVYSCKIIKETRSKLGIADDELVFLFVGTEFKRKGLDALLKGLALGPGKFKLIIAGEGGGKMQRYRKIARSHGLDKHVLFLGLVKNVEDLYSISDAFILPSLCEPYAMAPMEAMYAGLPTALSRSDYCGAAEHITKGEALVINNPSDYREIADVLQKFTDSKLRAELGRKGQALAHELTWEKTIESTLAGYAEVLRKKRS